jgi:putative transposase
VAAKRLEEFGNSEWGKKLPAIVQSWRRLWDQVTPFFAYPADIRKIIYTTNAIESLRMQRRKVLESRGHFPSDEAATKLIYLAIRNIIRRGGKNPPITWKLAATQFAIQFRRTIFPADAA